MTEQRPHPPVGVSDLAGVVYSSGRVFDGLTTGRLDTAEFLRTGNTDGISSRQDLFLLEDLRDVARLVIEHGTAHLPVDAAFLQTLNSTITRSGALHPGQFRREDQKIGVNTSHGRHEPPAIDAPGLHALITRATAGSSITENAIDLFVALAKAQPFEDGNKRTALFAANALLIGSDAGVLLTIPVDDDPSRTQTARAFNDRLARAYILDEDDEVKAMLREHGLKPLEADEQTTAQAEDQELRDRLSRLPGFGERPDLRPLATRTPAHRPTPSEGGPRRRLGHR